MRDWTACTALVVEDSAVQRDHMAGLLHQMGFGQVLEACDGIDALRVLDGHGAPVDLVVTDLDMPGMDGIDLMRHLGERELSAGIVVASARVSRMQEALDMVASGGPAPPLLGTALKPVHLDVLLPLLERAELLSVGGAPPVPELPELEAALADGHFVTYFQPKIEIATGTVRGLEALARWNHPTAGVLAPARFMQQVDNSTLAAAFGLFVARQAISQLRNLHGMGLSSLTMSINLPAALLLERSFIDKLSDLVHAHQLPPRAVIWDIGEAVLAASHPLAAANLAHLSLRGFGLALDDYGIGYTSLLQLSRCPLTELKIDRPFVHEASLRPNRKALLESSIEMARTLGVPAVAEGVELAGDWSLLRELGCAQAQGHLLANAMPANAVVGWIRNNRQRLRQLAS